MTKSSFDSSVLQGQIGAAYELARRGANAAVTHMGKGGRGAWKGSSGFYSGQRQAVQTANGAQGAKFRRQEAIQVTRNKNGKTSSSRTVIAGEGKRIMRDTTAHERPMIGSELIPSLATNRLPAVSLKLGKRLTKLDAITPFLKNLCQSGKMACQYGGRFKSDTQNSSANPMNQQGERMVVSQNFRHCWASKDFYNPSVDTSEPPANTDGYPDVAGNTTMGPICYSVSVPSFGGVQATVASPYYPHYNGQNNFSMISRPDCEDMMWNMNKLKLVADDSQFNDNVDNIGQSVGGYSLPANHANMPMFHRNVAAYQPNRHFRISAIMANNLYPASLSGDQPETEWTEAPYKYNAVFKHGTVKYDFKNCEMTGARVEIIVYKAKKNKVSSDRTSDFSSTNNPLKTDGRPLDNILPVIGQGYIDTVFDKVGTEDMGGRLPNKKDIFTNPMYPLLPELKKTKQGDMRFKEVSRTAFALTSGAQRTLEIVLPGDEYDPVNICTADPTSSTLGAGIASHACMDDHTYTVVIAVCGVKMTRMVSTVETADNNPTDTIVGEIHCPFNVEYLCTYTEHLGACKYKNPNAVNVFNNALVCDTSVKPEQGAANQVPASAITVVPLENTVRNTNKVILPAAVTGGIQMEIDKGVAGSKPI